MKHMLGTMSIGPQDSQEHFAQGSLWEPEDDGEFALLEYWCPHFTTITGGLGAGFTHLQSAMLSRRIVRRSRLFEHLFSFHRCRYSPFAHMWALSNPYFHRRKCVQMTLSSQSSLQLANSNPLFSRLSGEDGTETNWWQRALCYHLALCHHLV